MKIYINKSADKQLLKLPKSMRISIMIRIEQLKDNRVNLNIKKLKNIQDYRLRVGDYRVIYTIDHKTKEIIILSVTHRKEAYR